VNVIDSSDWLSYFAGDSNAAKFAAPISATEQLLVPSITITEVFKSILRQRGEEMALIAIAHMTKGIVVALDQELAVSAADLGVQFKLPLADSVIYATAQKFKATLWTQDADFKGLPGVNYYPARR